VGKHDATDTVRLRNAPPFLKCGAHSPFKENIVLSTVLSFLLLILYDFCSLRRKATI